MDGMVHWLFSCKINNKERDLTPKITETNTVINCSPLTLYDLCATDADTAHRQTQAARITAHFRVSEVSLFACLSVYTHIIRSRLRETVRERCRGWGMATSGRPRMQLASGASRNREKRRGKRSRSSRTSRLEAKQVSYSSVLAPPRYLYVCNT